MKISKQTILKILKAENLTDEQKSELMILMRENSDLLTDLIADKMTTKGTTAPKEDKKASTKVKKKSTKKGNVSKTGQIRDFVNAQKKNERFTIDDLVNATGLDRKTATNSLYVLYKKEEVQSEEKGIYFR